ncbi:MAG: SDR family NAD(P)-dependent oxidoreductase [Legionellaceae bacterium]|nr:SDR family NAD(P)-dependent oxidoreductase [Legionellaceae bacterium]
MTLAWVVGDGGMGTAINKALTEKGYDVIILSRKRGIDLLSKQALNQILTSHNHVPSLVINTCGMLHQPSHSPEKTIQQLDYVWLLKSIEANVAITINLAQVLAPHLSKHQALRFCAFSARVSSIADNHKGGWYSYRMSKIMLNMLIKNLAIEWQIKSPSSNVFAYHPGSVDTKLSAPFKQYIPKIQLFSPELAAHYFLKILFDDTIAKHGKLIDWQGLEIV